MSRRLWNAMLLGLIAATMAMDQWTKAIVRETLRFHSPRIFAGGLLTLLYTENSGAFLSLGANLPAGARTVIFSVLVGGALVMALAYLIGGKMHDRLPSIALALFVGGGAGNLIDRIARHGRVIDFMYLAAGPVHTGVFNVADLAITTGAVILVISWFLEKRATVATPVQ